MAISFCRADARAKRVVEQQLAQRPLQRRAIAGSDQKPGHPVGDDFRHCADGRNHRRHRGRHRFEQAHGKRPLVRRQREDRGALEQRPPAGGTDPARKRDRVGDAQALRESTDPYIRTFLT